MSSLVILYMYFRFHWNCIEGILKEISLRTLSLWSESQTLWFNVCIECIRKWFNPEAFTKSEWKQRSWDFLLDGSFKDPLGFYADWAQFPFIPAILWSHPFLQRRMEFLAAIQCFAPGLDYVTVSRRILSIYPAGSVQSLISDDFSKITFRELSVLVSIRLY